MRYKVTKSGIIEVTTSTWGGPRDNEMGYQFFITLFFKTKSRLRWNSLPDDILILKMWSTQVIKCTHTLDDKHTKYTALNAINKHVKWHSYCKVIIFQTI